MDRYNQDTTTVCIERSSVTVRHRDMGHGPRLIIVGHVAKLDVVVGGDLDGPGVVPRAMPRRVAAKVFLPRPGVPGRQSAEAESGADGAGLSGPEQMNGRCAAHDDDNGAFEGP